MIVGDTAQTPLTKLDNSKNNFERGKVRVTRAEPLQQASAALGALPCSVVSGCPFFPV
jgi:hypothetical protein